ncbi:MAG: hypothetical protein ABF294_01255 [Flavobacteriales bacterium]|jgi:cytochrome bd-type quinol oxidase subunit 2
MKNLLKYSCILLMVVFYSSSVFAQSQLRPPSAIIALVLMGMIVFVAGVSFLFARLVKAVLQKARKEKRKHIGYQIVFGVLFSIISHFARENQSVNDLLMSGGDEYFPNIYTVAIFTAICILTGSVIGYFITPIEHLEKN